MTDTPHTTPDLEDDPDAVHCESCGTATHCDAAIMHFDTYLCPICDADWRKQSDACAHVWETEATSPDGDAGRCCHKCSRFEIVEETDAAV